MALWKRYKYDHQLENKDIGLLERYNKYIIEVPDHDYKSLIHIIDHEKLNDIGYIVPGLGDAGDRVFGTK